MGCEEGVIHLQSKFGECDWTLRIRFGVKLFFIFYNSFHRLFAIDILHKRCTQPKNIVIPVYRDVSALLNQHRIDR